MHQRRAHLRRAGCRGPPHEGQDGEGVLRNPHVGPLCVVVLDHYAFILPPLGISLLTLKERQERIKPRAGILDEDAVSMAGITASIPVRPNADILSVVLSGH